MEEAVVLLFSAAKEGNLEEVRRIIFRMPGTGLAPQRLALLETVNADGQTAADVATDVGQEEIADLLRAEALRMRFSE
jgi:hypothetical protein